MERVSEDKGYNRYGSQMLDFCKETGLRIINGRVGKDKGIGKCLYVGSAGKSVVDYVIASQCLFSAIDTFEVSDPNILNDHCMVKFSVISHDSISNDDCMNNFGSFCNFKYVWKDNEVDSYQNALQSNNVQGVLNDLKSNISNLTTVDELNQNVKSFQEIIEEVCNPLFKKDISKPRVQNCPIVDESNQPWFNGNCKQKREVFFRTLDVYRLNKEDNDYRVNMVKARSDYKKVLRNSRMEYRKVQTQQLEMHHYDNAVILEIAKTSLFNKFTENY